MPSFFNGKRFFLTYAQCPIDKERMLEHFQSKGELVNYVIGREKHADGNYHIHACLEFKTTQRHNVRWLDIDNYHPRKDDPRSWKACQNYTKKDGDFIEGESRVEPKTNLAEVLACMGGEEEWMQYCVDNKITFQYARWYWDRWATGSNIMNDECEGTICDELKALKFNEDTRKAWIIKGKSGCGKTTWAKRNAPKPALFVSHIDQLKKFVPLFHKSIIFDDVSFNHYPRHSQIHLLDFDNTRAIHCRHSVATIPNGIHKIFTCNEWPVTRGDPAIERRIQCFVIN